MIINMVGQLMVVMFLFYSGYGILESYKTKNRYKESFFRNRFLKTLLNFDIAVGLFAILSLFIGHKYSTSDYLLSFTAWSSIGNSNWFVFDILVLYLATCGCLYLFNPDKIKNIVWTMYALSFMLIVILYLTKHGSYWYDTILSFPTGMLFSIYKQRIEKIFKHNLLFYISLTISGVSFIILMKYGHGIGQLLNSILFPMLIVMFTTRVRIGNKILRWLGVQCFAVYILQRIPMIVYSELGLNDNWILFAIAVIPTTLLLASIFTALTNRLNYRIFTH